MLHREIDYQGRTQRGGKAYDRREPLLAQVERRRLRKVQFRSVPGGRTRQMPRRCRLRVHEKPRRKDIYAPEPESVGLRAQSHVDRRHAGEERRKRVDCRITQTAAQS